MFFFIEKMTPNDFKWWVRFLRLEWHTHFQTTSHFLSRPPVAPLSQRALWHKSFANMARSRRYLHRFNFSEFSAMFVWYILFLLAFSSSSDAWDQTDLELFDLVEEIQLNFYEVLEIDQVSSIQLTVDHWWHIPSSVRLYGTTCSVLCAAAQTGCNG